MEVRNPEKTNHQSWWRNTNTTATVGIAFLIVIAVFFTGFWIIPDSGRVWAGESEGAIAAISTAISAVVAILTLQTLRFAINLAKQEDLREELRHLRSIRPLLSLSIDDVNPVDHGGLYSDILLEILNAGPGPAINIDVRFKVCETFHGLIEWNSMTMQSPFTLAPNGRTTTGFQFKSRQAPLTAALSAIDASGTLEVAHIRIEYDDLAQQRFQTSQSLLFELESDGPSYLRGLKLSPAQIS